MLSTSKPARTVAYLGPSGTFSHLAAKKRFGGGVNCRFVPGSTVGDVFDYVSQDRSRLGVVPIENSSGGTIYDTVDRLVDKNCRLFIRESLSINVRLALVSKSSERDIRVIYSHFAPLYHCEDWLDAHFPRAEIRKEPSTAAAVKKAASEKGAAAIGNVESAKRHGLQVLKFPIKPEVQNVTQFFVLGHEEPDPRRGSKTSLVFTLQNKPGTLVGFLEPFAAKRVNLSRIISRPIQGQPETYVFLVDVQGVVSQPNVRDAIKQARKVTSTLRNAGAYEVLNPYDS